MIKPYKGICIRCNKHKWIRNSRKICVDCVYEQNHNGRSRYEQAKYSPTKEKDREWYYYIFTNTKPFCEECGIELPNVFLDKKGYVNAVYQYSHILTKGAYPHFRHHKLNYNRLCRDCHNEWEFGDRKSMFIYTKNQQIVEKIHKNPHYIL